MHDGAEEVDPSAAAPPLVVRAAAGVAAFTGLMVGLTGLQLLLSVRFAHVGLAVVPYAMLLLGGGQIMLAVFVARARAWAAVASLVVAGFALLSMGTWLVFSVTSGIYSCVGLVVPPLALAAVVTGALSIGPARRADAARRRMRDEGMDLGL